MGDQEVILPEMFRAIFRKDLKNTEFHQFSVHQVSLRCHDASTQTFSRPGSTLHGYLSKILARSCQDLGKILAKIVTRYLQELQDAMVRSYQESHVSIGAGRVFR